MPSSGPSVDPRAVGVTVGEDDASKRAVWHGADLPSSKTCGWRRDSFVADRAGHCVESPELRACSLIGNSVFLRVCLEASLLNGRLCESEVRA